MKTEMRKPVLFRTGKRIGLGPMEKSNLDFAYRCMNDPDTHTGLTVIKPLTREDEEKWFNSLSERKDDVILAIYLIKTGEMIGAVGLHHIDHLNGVAVTGTWIGREEHRGKGFGTEAKMLLLEYAFNTLNLRKIRAEVYDFNQASQKCLAKCGYKPEGVFVQEKYRNGRFVDVHQMAVFKEDFIPLWKKYCEQFLK